MVALPVPAEAANPSDGFKPGNIISDANFYDGNAMSVGEVQSFLNKRVPSCWLGRPGYEIGKPVSWNGPTKLASKCLRDFRINTSTEIANPYCAAIPGQKNESAASVIVRVGKACGISPKVLLVMLDKEQSLVSDPWPNENQYFYAMGYACPDSGPGNTANCDASRGGFAKQVYRAAWQYKVYKAFPNDYRYRPFQTNTIQWHEHASCGTSQVKIENYATAGLYIYTPYRPNQASLDAGWGTGNSCSSYGNRNFYNYYKAWFGSPTGSHVIDEKYRAVGGAAGVLGAPVSGVEHYPNGGLGQRFAGGSIYYSPGTGARVVTDPVRSAYMSAGSWRGVLGFPAKDVESYPNGGFGQLFEGGSVYYSPGTGARVVTDPVRSAYMSAGSWRGVLGFPAKDVESYPNGGFGQLFEGGSVYYSPGTGARVVTDPVRSAYMSAGSWRGVLGFPAKDVESYPNGGFGQLFEGGSVYYSPGTGARVVTDPVRSAYMSAGSWRGVLGFPAKDVESYPNGGFGQLFEGGSVYYSPGTGARVVTDPVRSAYMSAGSWRGVLGFPAKDVESYPNGGFGQLFEGGSVYYSPGTGARVVTDPVRSAYMSAGSWRGVLGFPRTDLQEANGSQVQYFEGGVITVDAETGQVKISTDQSELTADRIEQEGMPDSEPAPEPVADDTVGE